ncbi:MAG: GSCFA domain-containing protein [Bacteroidia bacterium]|nr:GSCFA domain-containing protein [Bacteroidia bacterium]
MKFKLELDIPPLGSINYQKPVLCIGSCFAQNIGRRLIDNRFKVVLNPNGILFNPISIGNALLAKNYSEADLVERDEVWFSWQHHSSFSGTSRETVLHGIQREHELLTSTLENSEHSLFLTLGSAWVYEYEGKVVANCHKQPNGQFTKRLLSIEEIVAHLGPILEKSKAKQVVLTVSPVRYVKDGLHNNNLSKATLLLAVKKLCDLVKHVHYFPAYEMVIDELRDYRFFDRDLVHPSEEAIDYVWEAFRKTYFDSQSLEMARAWSNIKSRLNHRILHPDTKTAKSFLSKLADDQRKFETGYFP